MITKQYVQTVDKVHTLSEKNIVLFGRMVALIFAKNMSFKAVKGLPVVQS